MKLTTLATIVSALAVLAIFINAAEASSMLVFVNVSSVQPWDDIERPDGLYELTGVYPWPVTYDNFTIKIVNLTAYDGDRFYCYIKKSDGTDMELSREIVGDIVKQNITFNYTLQSGDPSGAYEFSWYIDNCTLNSSVTRNFTNETDYPVFVKADSWYFTAGGLTKSNDAANAYISWKGGTRSYFSHDDALEKDIIFSVMKYSGVHRFEGNCTDGIDNEPYPFNDSLIDCNDPDCQVVFWEHCGHNISYGGLGQFSMKMIELGSRTLSFAGPTALPASPCAGNICGFNVGGASVQYTQSISPSGQLKVKVERSIPTAEIVFITLKNLTSSAISMTNSSTSIFGPNPLPYKWLAPSGGPPFYTFIGSSKRNASSTEMFSGGMNMVMNTSLSGAPVGIYLMDLDVFVGSGKGDQSFTIYTDSNAPDNYYENDTKLQHVSTHYITGTQTTTDQACNDGIDNDLNYDSTDCRDSDCNASQVGVTLGNDSIRCEYAAEQTCWDNFDNDGDGLTDCADPDCNRDVGGYVLTNGTVVKYYVSGANLVACDFPEGTYNYTASGSTLGSCADNFNNDAEDNTDCYDVTACWGKGWKNISIIQYPCPAFEDNDASWCSDGKDNDFDKYVHSSMRAGYATNIGVDCDDYDCAGATNCPLLETKTAGGITNLAQCFDGIDNDLDAWYWNGATYVRDTATGVDCADPDCAWAINPADPDTVCVPTEFNLAWMNFSSLSYDYCDDSVDNDVDAGSFQGGTDCTDKNSSFGDSTDCWQRFNGCGPCPSEENYTWNSCMDNTDSDYDNGASGYDTSPATGTDCSDNDCDSDLASMDSQLCEYNTETSCADGFDNDRDGSTDCADPQCSGSTGPDGQTCGPESSGGACTDDYDNDADSLTDCMDSGCWGVSCALSWGSGSCLTVPSNATIVLNPAGDISVTYRNRVHIEDDDFIARFTSLRSLSGASVILVLGQYPTNDISFNVTSSEITLSGPSASSFTKVFSEGVLVLSSNTTISSLDLSVTIPIPDDTPLGTETFPVLSQSVSGQGNGNIGVTIYENQPPSITKIEIEPKNSSGYANVKYGQSVGIRAIPDDSSSGGSNICGCYFSINGSTPAFEGDCIYETTLYTEGYYDVSVSAVDEPDNVGQATYDNFTLNILPIQAYNNNLNKVFSKQSLGSITVGSSFLTALGDTFASQCNVRIFNDTDTIYQTNVSNTGPSNAAYCSDNVNVPSGTPALDGLYWVTTNTTDSDGDSITSTKKFFFMCDNINSSGATPSGAKWNCRKADWDSDGITDGVTTSLWAPGYVQQCDNCLDLSNPDQNDTDLDGVGDGCDNCPEKWNPDQKDSDGNGVGNACEPLIPPEEEIPSYPGIIIPIPPKEIEIPEIPTIPPIEYTVTMPRQLDIYQSIPMYFSIMNPTENPIVRLIFIEIAKGDIIYYYKSFVVSVPDFSIRKWIYMPGILYCGMPKGEYDVTVEWFDDHANRVQVDNIKFTLANECIMPKELLYLLLLIILVLLINVRRCNNCGRLSIFTVRYRKIRLCPDCRKRYRKYYQ